MLAGSGGLPGKANIRDGRLAGAPAVAGAGERDVAGERAGAGARGVAGGAGGGLVRVAASPPFPRPVRLAFPRPVRVVVRRVAGVAVAVGGEPDGRPW